MGRSISRTCPMQPSKLKLGILLDTLDVPAWAASAIQRIVDRDSGEFRLVILNQAASGGKAGRDHYRIYSIFDRLDRALFSRKPDPFRPTSIQALLAGVPQIRVDPISGGDHDELGESDIRSIQEYGLDVVIRVGFERLACGGLRLAKYGVWYYYHGDDTRTSGGPAGFWEVAEGRTETGTALLAEGGDQYASRVLYRSYFFTYPLSPARHRSYYFWAAASFLPRQIEYLQRYGEAKFWQQTAQFNQRVPGAIQQYATPSGLAAVAALGKIVRRLLAELVKRLFYLDQWFLLFSLEKGIGDGFKSFHALIPPKDRFWADPHAVQRDQAYYLFIEEFLYAKKKGHISVIEIGESGSWKPPVKVLEQGCHLSYPFVFEWSGKYYMVPESGGNRSIDLYESTDFPYKWEFKQTLMRDVKAVDTTLLHHAGKWWLFTAMAENEAAAPNVELFLFSSEQLLDGQWVPHPQNPIVSDVKRARPAGAIFMQDGKLFRPSQDCSQGYYGYGFDLNEIVLLSDSEYCEQPRLAVRPDWDQRVHATHTYANLGKLTAIDAFAHVRRTG